MAKTVLDYNRIADKYSRVREKDWKEFDFLFGRHLSPGISVLDLGCGNGRFYPAFCKRMVEYAGIDASSRLVETAKKNYPEADFREGPIEAVAGSFDQIWSLAVLHHIPSRETRIDFLKKIKERLKDGGRVVLTVWNLQEKMNRRGILERLFLDKGDVFLPWYGSKKTYFHCFNLEELVQLVKGAGFEIIEKGEILVGGRPYSNFYIVGNKKK